MTGIKKDLSWAHAQLTAEYEKYRHGTPGDQYRTGWAKDLADAIGEPIPMILFCPLCGVQHIDKADEDASAYPDGHESRWDNPPHRSHLCAACGCIWRPADVPTTGVERIATRGKADTFDADKGRVLSRKVTTEGYGYAARVPMNALEQKWFPVMKVFKTDPRAALPARATDGAACWDVQALDRALIPPGTAKTLSTGLKFAVPDGYMMLVFSRSGHGFKKGLRLANCVGVIDADYRGELLVRLHNDSSEKRAIAPMDRVAQIMLVKLPEVMIAEVPDAAELGTTARGENGIGSTGG